MEQNPYKAVFYFSEIIRTDFWSKADIHDSAGMANFMKDNHVDVAAFYSYDKSMDKSFETTHIFKTMESFWVIPKKRRPSFLISKASHIILIHVGFCVFLVALCWLISTLKKVDLQFMLVAEMILFQPVQYLPKVDWLRWLIPFCILMLVNIDVAIQSNFRVLLTLPRYDQSIQDLYDVASSQYCILGTKPTFTMIANVVDNKTYEELRRKWHFQARPVTPEQIVSESDRIMLINSFNLGFFNNPQDVLKKNEVCT